MKKTSKQFNCYILVVFLSFIFTNLIIAQGKNYVPGFIITNQQDTIQGFINNKGWDKNPKNIDFKNLKGKITPYSANEIRSFQIKNGVLFESYLVTYDIASIKVNEIDYDTAEELITNTVFLRAEVLGPVSLYYFKDDTRKTHLFLKTEGEEVPYELIFRRRFKEFTARTMSEVGGLRMVTEKKYITQLQSALKACPELREDISKISYSLKEVKKILQAYYQCGKEKESSNYNSAKDKRFKVRPTVVLGWGQTGLKTGGELGRWLTDFQPGLSSTINLGIGTEFVFLKRRKQMSFVFEFIYRQTRHEQVIDQELTVSLHALGNRKVQLDYLRVNFMFRHTLPLKKIKPFYQFGFANGVALNYINTANYDQISSSGEIRERNENVVQSLRAIEQGWGLGLGLQFQDKAELEFRMERGNGFAWSSVYFIKTRSYFIFGRYRF